MSKTNLTREEIGLLKATNQLPAQPERKVMITYFEELCGPHLDQSVYLLSTADLAESYFNSLKDQS